MTVELLFGKNITWGELIRWRVENFTPLAELIDGKVETNHKTQPYGLPNVTRGDKQAIVAVVHRKDFANAWSIYRTGLARDTDVVVVSYLKHKGLLKRMLGAALPHLVFQVYSAHDSNLSNPIHEIWPDD